MEKIRFENLVGRAIKALVNQRTREIIAQRFGLEDGQPQTLEAIGQQYGITRERVRQIQEVAFSELKKSRAINYFQPAFASLDRFLKSQGSLCREERLFNSLTGKEEPHPSRGALFLILSLGQPYQRLVESNHFYSLWYNQKSALKRAEQVVGQLVKELRQSQEPVSLAKLFELVKKRRMKLNQQWLVSYLDASKPIEQNSFGYYGLAHWPEIRPRGVRDKAYIILKEKKQPLHFRQVTALINQANLDPKVAQAQTVHNELIKDSRFVLVGRGIYALAEWGYQPGTVRDIIINLLKAKGPLTKEAIIKAVLKDRLVKENTVLINLQNRQYFARQADGRYALVRQARV